MEHIGQVFTNPVIVNLLPFQILPPAYYHINISYITGQQYAMVYHNSTFNTIARSELRVVLGNDVRTIMISVQDMNSPRTWRFGIDTHHLVLLNLAEKLLRPL